MSNVTIFVYGTLKSGLTNNYLITTNGGKSLGLGKLVRPDYVLTTGYSFPYAVSITPGQACFLQSKGVVTTIHGELFSINDCILADLDRLEDIRTTTTDP